MLLSSLDFSNAGNYKVAFIRTRSRTGSRTGVRLSHFESISPVHASSVPPSHWLPGYNHLGVNVGLFQLYPFASFPAAKDDGSVAVALGYTSHLVLMVSCLLQVPLRYPVMHKGSRSSIKDTITDRLSERERE